MTTTSHNLMMAFNLTPCDDIVVKPPSIKISPSLLTAICRDANKRQQDRCSDPGRRRRVWSPSRYSVKSKFNPYASIFSLTRGNKLQSRNTIGPGFSDGKNVMSQSSRRGEKKYMIPSPFLSIQQPPFDVSILPRATANCVVWS